MSAPPKIAAGSVSSQRGQLYRAAIVGAGTLKGKEVAEMLNERNFPAVDIRLLDDDESIGQLEANRLASSKPRATRSTLSRACARSNLRM